VDSLAGTNSGCGLKRRGVFSSEDQSYPYDALDGPPTEADNFEWDEQHVSIVGQSHFLKFAPSSTVNTDDDGPCTVTDGMATLTMSEKESGYLGVSSGAALLKIIDPSSAGHLDQRNRGLRRHFRASPSDPGHVLLYAPI
jgi:transcriptional regulatory protein GAL4